MWLSHQHLCADNPWLPDGDGRVESALEWMCLLRVQRLWSRGRQCGYLSWSARSGGQSKPPRYNLEPRSLRLSARQHAVSDWKEQAVISLLCRARWSVLRFELIEKQRGCIADLRDLCDLRFADLCTFPPTCLCSSGNLDFHFGCSMPLPLASSSLTERLYFWAAWQAAIVNIICSHAVLQAWLLYMKKVRCLVGLGFQPPSLLKLLIGASDWTSTHNLLVFLSVVAHWSQSIAHL